MTGMGEKGLQFISDQRHGHAPGAAAAAGELRRGDLQHFNAPVPQDGVGDVVALIDHDLARGDAEGVGAVVPLLPGRRDHVPAAAGDELHPVHPQGLGQDGGELGVDAPDTEAALVRRPRGQLIDREGAKNGRVDGELVPVDLGEDRVQVHEGTAVGNVKGQHPPEAAAGVPEEAPGGGFDAVGAGALGDADGQGIFCQHQHVAALQTAVEVPVIVAGDQPRKVRVIAEEIIGIQGLPPPGGVAHPVEEHALAHGGEGIPGEIQVRHGVHDQIIGRGGHILQGIGLHVAHLREGDALHGLLHQSFALIVGADVIDELVLPALGADLPLNEPLTEERLQQLGIEPQHLRHQILQVHYLHTLAAQGPGKGVVLGLGYPEKRNIVEQQFSQPVRRETQKLPTRAVQQHLAQLADLVMDADSLHIFPFPAPDRKHRSGAAVNSRRYYTQSFGKFQQKSGERLRSFLCEAAKNGKRVIGQKSGKKDLHFRKGCATILRHKKCAVSSAG